MDVNETELLFPDRDKHLQPVVELLNSNFLNELPLELFGIEFQKIVEIIANAPLEVGAFISTLVELARNYALAEEHFYLGALRSYVELHNNYFPELEEAVINFSSQFSFNPHQRDVIKSLEFILTNSFGYEIIYDGLKKYPELKSIRSVFVPHSKRLLLAPSLSSIQIAFQFGKELGFQYLGLKDRSLTSNLIRISSFTEVLNHFKASYFSCALLIERKSFLEDIKSFFAKEKADLTQMRHLLEKYHASPEMLFQRMTNILPKLLGIDKIFFLRFITKPSNGGFKLDTALHFSIRHQPHINSLNEHYCRRWLSITLLQKLAVANNDSYSVLGNQKILFDIQRSIFHNSNVDYLCLTMARTAYPEEDKNVSITLGILIDDNSRKKISFVDDESIETRIVNTTCERCPIQDCQERVAPPIVVEEKKKKKLIEETVALIINKEKE